MCDKTHLEVEAEKAEAVSGVADRLAWVIGLLGSTIGWLHFHSWLAALAMGLVSWYCVFYPYEKRHKELQAKLYREQNGVAKPY